MSIGRGKGLMRLGGVLVIIVALVTALGVLAEPRSSAEHAPGNPGTSRPNLSDIIANLSDPPAEGAPDFSDAEITEFSDERCFAGRTNAQTSIAGATVILDPGHGGEDLGTVNRDFELTESELVLSISHFLRARLVTSGANVCMTRVADHAVALHERAEFANQHAGDVFVSVHLNHLPDPSENYTMTMWANEAKDKFLAQTMLTSLAVEMSTPDWHNGDPNPMDPQVVRLDYLDSNMLRNADMPAVLVEASFLSSAWEARAFLDGIEDGSRWREHQIADAVHAGLIEYFAVFR